MTVVSHTDFKTWVNFSTFAVHKTKVLILREAHQKMLYFLVHFEQISHKTYLEGFSNFKYLNSGVLEKTQGLWKKTQAFLEKTQAFQLQNSTNW